MPSACPRCRTPLPVPLPPKCGNCGEVLNGATSRPPALAHPGHGGPPIPLVQAMPAQPNAPQNAAPGNGQPKSTIKGPRLSGRLADGKFGEFALGVKTTLGRHPANTLRLVDREVSK